MNALNLLHMQPGKQVSCRAARQASSMYVYGPHCCSRPVSAAVRAEKQLQTKQAQTLHVVRSGDHEEADTAAPQQGYQHTVAALPAAPPQWVWEESNDAIKAYAVFFGWLALGSLPQIQTSGNADLVYFLGLAVLTTYIGSHRGLTSKSRQQMSIREGLLAPVLASCSLFGLYLVIKFIPDLSLQTFFDAYFWLLGSLAIYGATKPLLRFMSGPLGKQSIDWNPPKGLVIDENGEEMETVQLAPSDLVAVGVALGLATGELLGHHTSFTLNNMVACLVATEILALVGVRSFRTAALLLVGLLAYDVFWVFGSPSVVGENVMLQVATSDLIVGPTRLLFPRAPGGIGEAADFPFSLLGLGDIAIPGLLAALALRYDASRITNMQARAVAAAAAISDALSALQPGATGRDMANAAATAADAAYDKVADKELRQQNNTQGITSVTQGANSSGSNSNSSSPKSPNNSSTDAAVDSKQHLVPVSPEVLQQRTYFTRMACAHVAGLVAAFAANSITHLGQPALLYIVPSMLLTVAGTAALRQELGRVWKFTDVPTFGVPVKKD